MPASIRASVQGTAQAFQASLASEPLLILAALVTVYIVLGVLYESYIHPLTILAGLPSAAVGALLWIEATVWKTLQPAPDAARAEQIASVLADVSAALFSVDGEPALALAESPVATALGQGGDTDPVCDGPAWLGDAECSDNLYGVEDPMDSIEMEAMERTMIDWNSSDQGG